MADYQFIKVTEENGQTRIAYRARSSGQWVFMGYAVALLLLYGGFLVIGTPDSYYGIGLTMALLTYYCLVVISGRWTFIVGQEEIRRRFGPFPWAFRQNRRFAAPAVVQLYVINSYTGQPITKTHSVIYTLRARYEDGSEQNFITRQDNYFALRELEAALELALDIRTDVRFDLSERGMSHPELLAKIEYYQAQLSYTRGLGTWANYYERRLIAAQHELAAYEVKRSGVE